VCTMPAVSSLNSSYIPHIFTQDWKRKFGKRTCKFVLFDMSPRGGLLFVLESNPHAYESILHLTGRRVVILFGYHVQ
jgi:hypothetical protein